MPALPLHEAGKYVAGAYIVFVALILVYVSIMSVRLSRIQRELGELIAIAERRRRGGSSAVDGLDSPVDGADAGDAVAADEPVGAQRR